MAVNVQLVRPSADGTTEIQVSAGQHVDVCEEALVVLDGVDGNRVALFASGTWLSAQVED